MRRGRFLLVEDLGPVALPANLVFRDDRTMWLGIINCRWVRKWKVLPPWIGNRR